MSPEQICGRTVDSRSDILALGAVLYEMLCGRRPFEADTAPGMLAAVLHYTKIPTLPARCSRTYPRRSNKL